MSLLRLVDDVFGIIEEHASAMPEGAYLELSNLLKRIHEHAPVGAAPAPGPAIPETRNTLVAMLKAKNQHPAIKAKLVLVCKTVFAYNGELIDEERLEFEAYSDGMKALVELLVAPGDYCYEVDIAEGSFDDVKDAVLDVLAEAAAFPMPYPIQKALDAGVFPTLLELITGSTDGRKASAARVIAHMARHRCFDDPPDLYEAISPLIAMLGGSNSNDSKLWAAKALGGIICDADSARMLAQGGGMPRLVALMNNGSDETTEAAADVLSTMAKYGLGE